MRFKFKIFWLVFIILLIGCSNRGLEDITLPKNKHLEETDAGAWIKVFDLTYDNNSRYITNKISYILLENSQLPLVLIDKYTKDNDSVTFVWEISKTEYPFNQRDRLVIYETLTRGMQPLITLKLCPPGLPWSILIPEHCELLEPNRKLEHAVTILSYADNGARLFLFGWGNYCTEIGLF